MKYLVLPIFILISLAACKKPKVQTINTNNSRDSLTYQPKVAGSKWTYTRTTLGLNTTYNFLRLTTDTTYYGSVYNMFNSDIDGTQYIRQDGDKYYSILTASTNKPEQLVLDVSKNIGESWVGVVNGSDTYTYTMKQKIPTYVLDGFTFKNVLVVHLERTTTSGASTISGDTYYAQGVGQVKTEGTVLINGIQVAVNVKLIILDLK
jgi:hypothetical protein